METPTLQAHSPLSRIQCRLFPEIETGSLWLKALTGDAATVQEASTKAPPSSPVSEDETTIRSKRTTGSDNSTRGKDAAIAASLVGSRNTKGKVTVREMVEWISAYHEPLKLPQSRDSEVQSNEPSHSAPRGRIEHQMEESSQVYPRLKANIGADKTKDPSQPSVEKTGIQQQKKTLRAVSPQELQRIEDYQFLALAKRDLKQLEAEIELCCQETAGLHGMVRQEMERIIESALRTIKHGGSMDVNQAVEYNDNLLQMQRKFEDLSTRLQKSKADLASVKRIVSDCARIRCKCWWCRGYNSFRKLIPINLRGTRRLSPSRPVASPS